MPGGGIGAVDRVTEWSKALASDLGISSPAEESYKAARDSLCHIVQDEETCTRIHAEVLPPLEYDRLAVTLMAKADVDLVEHVVSLAAAFDTASASAISFGIN